MEFVTDGLVDRGGVNTEDISRISGLGNERGDTRGKAIFCFDFGSRKRND